MDSGIYQLKDNKRNGERIIKKNKEKENLVVNKKSNRNHDVTVKQYTNERKYRISISGRNATNISAST